MQLGHLKEIIVTCSQTTENVKVFLSRLISVKIIQLHSLYIHTYIHTCYMRRSPLSRWSGLHHTHLFYGVACSSAKSLTASLLQLMLSTPVKSATSSSTQAIQPLWARPLSLFSWFGFQSNKQLGNRVCGILTTCPYHLTLAELMKVSIDLIPACLRTFSLETWKNYLIFKILLREVRW